MSPSAVSACPESLVVLSCTALFIRFDSPTRSVYCKMAYAAVLLVNLVGGLLHHCQSVMDLYMYHIRMTYLLLRCFRLYIYGLSSNRSCNFVTVDSCICMS